MKENIAITELENAKRRILQANLKKEVLEELESIEKAINVLKGQSGSSPTIHALHAPLPPASSMQGLVINAIIELIHMKGRQVSNGEILSYLEEKQISLGKMKNKAAALDGKIKQVERGKYYLK